MSRILFLATHLPSFKPPLAQTAGLLSDLSTRHQVSLVYFALAQENHQPEKAYTNLSQLFERVASLKKSWSGQAAKAKLNQELEQFRPEIIVAETSAMARLLQVPPGVQLLILQAAKSKAQELAIAFEPGLDADYFRRRSQIKLISKQVLCSIQLASKQEAAIGQAAINLLIGEVWPIVRQRHPEASLKIKVSGEIPKNLVAEEKLEAGYHLGFGTISPLEYEAGRLALAPYLKLTPVNPQAWLEAWAMQLPLITLPAAAFSLDKLGSRLGEHFLKGEDGPSLAALISRLLEIRGPGLHLAENGRKLIDTRFSWQARAAQLEVFATAGPKQ